MKKSTFLGNVTQSKQFFGNQSIFLAITYFLLSCGALERSSNPYIESTVEPCVSKNQKGIFAVWGVSLEENTEKALRQLKKYPLAESEICVCVREKKKTVLKFM